VAALAVGERRGRRFRRRVGERGLEPGVPEEEPARKGEGVFYENEDGGGRGGPPSPVLESEERT